MENNKILRLILPHEKFSENKTGSNDFQSLLFDIKKTKSWYDSNIKKIVEKSINFFNGEAALNIDEKVRKKLKNAFKIRNDLGKFKTWIQLKMNVNTKKIRAFIIELLVFENGKSADIFYKNIDFVINSYKKKQIEPDSENPDVKKQTSNLINDKKIAVFVRILCDKKKYEIAIDYL